jgi:2-hydroxychromene-2-carboxylate isomerase
MPSSSAPTTAPLFLVDLGSPYAYLAAERIDDVVGPATWQVVLLGGIFRATGRSSWGDGPGRDVGRIEVQRRAAAQGLPEVRWPEPWPSDGLLVARMATWADQRGTGRAFISEALRMHFRDGRTLSDPTVVAEVARRAGLDPDDALAGATSAEAKAELRRRTDDAVSRGVFGVPSVVVGPFVVWGDDQLEQAATLARGWR